MGEGKAATRRFIAVCSPPHEIAKNRLPCQTTVGFIRWERDFTHPTYSWSVFAACSRLCRSSIRCTRTVP